jgi:hypothetical protein
MAMEFHVFIKHGDARPEVDRLLRELGSSPEAAGLHKYIYAEQARQTVVMLSGADAPLAGALRARSGWQEPAAGNPN